ncbi:FkbM family methyltransferase [Alphaproteobacteria bacterium]|nr:FkbM family methyltransferase [Alphaproteobacteria bacterium]
MNFYKIKKINHKNQELKFHIINYLTYYRASTFSDKEPETLEWIESFNENTIFFDIGSNIGLYSIYAAKLKKSKVYCFEPSVFNLELLVQNIHLNNVNDNTVILPLALNDKNSIEAFNLSNLSKGGALSSFGKNYNQYGEKINIKNYYYTVGMKLDNLVKYLNIDFPNYIKIDVDGIEHLILNGMTDILEKTQSILIEITESFEEQSKICKEILTSKGFVQKKIKNDSNLLTQNQIWNRY